MTVLSSANIIDKLYVSDPRDTNRLFITPTPKRTEIKDASVDLMLGNYFIVTKTAKFSVLDAHQKASKQAIQNPPPIFRSSDFRGLRTIFRAHAEGYLKISIR